MSILDFLAIESKIDDKNVEGTFEYWRSILNTLLTFIHIGSGAPESVEVGSIGHLYLRTAGGAKTCIYIKESGTNTNTGWVAVRT